MKLKCQHGYFTAEETKVGQVADFMGYTGLKLVPKGQFFTFEDLENAPEYSLPLKPILNGLPASVVFEGTPAEVFKANKVVYDFSRGLLVPIDSITNVTRVSVAGEYFTSPGLIVPGSLTEDGQRVMDYAAWFSRNTLRWLYSEVTYVPNP